MSLPGLLRVINSLLANLLSVAHDGSVLSVNIDGLTQLTLTCGADCFVKFWKFKTCQLLNELKMDAAVAMATLHRDRLMSISLYSRQFVTSAKNDKIAWKYRKQQI